MIELIVMNLTNIGSLVHQRRQALGLSQDRLAKLSGLSRATINQLETGALNDLGAAKLIGLLDLLGLKLQVNTASRPRNALKLVSQTASVSYKHALNSSELARALVAGELPNNMLAQVATLLDEAPLLLIVGAVEEIANAYHQPPKVLWKNIMRWAHEVQSQRSVWT